MLVIHKARHSCYDIQMLPEHMHSYYGVQMLSAEPPGMGHWLSTWVIGSHGKERVLVQQGRWHIMPNTLFPCHAVFMPCHKGCCDHIATRPELIQ